MKTYHTNRQRLASRNEPVQVLDCTGGGRERLAAHVCMLIDVLTAYLDERPIDWLLWCYGAMVLWCYGAVVAGGLALIGVKLTPATSARAKWLLL